MKRNIPVGWLKIGKSERKAINQVLDSGRISEYAKTAEFERKWSEFIGTKYCVCTSSGTAALITALTAFKYLYRLEKSPKVITSPLTYISDVNALVLSGFEPVFVNIDPYSFCITPENIAEHLESAADIEKYSIILPIDLMGFPARIDEIKKIAKRYNLFVLEDAAQAHGTTYKGKKCGSLADAAIFSFYIAHNIQAGEMGAVVTNNFEIYRLSKKIKASGRLCECNICRRSSGRCPFLSSFKRNQDLDPRFLHDLIGYNFKITEFQAALALVQLKHIKEIIKKRRENVKRLNEGLGIFKEILQLPRYDENISYLAYPIVIKKPQILSRRVLRYELEKRGIETRPLFGCIPTQQPAYAYLKPLYKNKLTHAEFIGRNGFYIGAHQYLTDRDLEYMISVFKKVMPRSK